jgi:glycosyltransferase
VKISVVTAVYNRAATIGEAMQSVQSQTGVDIEHIIQDGGSTDPTLDIVQANALANTFVISARDGGIYDAINRGIARATGDVIGLLHSDDFFAHDHVLEKVAKAFEDPNIDGVYGDLDYVSAQDTSRIVRHWRSGAYRPGKLKRGWMPPHPTVYLRREVFETHGLYDTSMQISADYDAMLRYLLRGGINVAYIPDVLVKMRTGGASNRSLSNLIQKSREDFRAIRRNRAGGVGALFMKNASKLGQFIPKG